MISDEKLLAMFGATTVTPLTHDVVCSMSPNDRSRLFSSRYVIVAETTDWKLVADDWSYTLWHRPTTKQVVLDLARQFEILTFSLGDSDEAYDLRHFVNGALVRELLVDDAFGGGDQRVMVDDGKRLPGELDPLGQNELLHYLRTIAGANGFDLRDGLATSRVWIDKSPKSRVSAEDETSRRTRSWKKSPG